MAKIRAYKLAEELGIERGEFVERAAEAGVELKSAMASLEPDEVETLRAKLGTRAPARDVDEERVEVSGSTTVIRRRRRKKKTAEAAAEPAAESAEVPAESGEAAPPAPTTEPSSAPEVGEPAAEELPQVEPVGQPAAAAEPAQPAAARAPGQGSAEESRPAAAPRPAARRDEPAPPQDDRKGRQRKRVREVVNLREQEQFARQVTSRGSASRRTTTVAPRAMQNPRRRRRDAPAPATAGTTVRSEQKKVVRVEGDISVGELAKQLGVKAAQLQGKLMALGTMVAVNQPVGFDTAQQVAKEYDFEVEDVGFKEEDVLEVSPEEEVGEEAGGSRAPVVTVMGHVDHGKTSLLDAIRNANVTEGEAGGITQHIGAYQARSGDSVLTFIDTPGHAAFTQMRARGAQATDIVVLVVAADDGVMPQTVEAIEHARAAGCPIIVAVNKCDLPGANPQQARQRLMEHELVPEDFGGDTICVDVSAVKGTGIEQLLEMIALQAEVLELRADPSRRATGVVLEARLEKGRGPAATILVQNGTLEKGDVVVVGTEWGRVRIMENDQGKRVSEAGPSVPVQLFGLSGVPGAGEQLHVVKNERDAKQVIGHRLDQERSQPAAPRPVLSLEEIFAQREGEGPKELAVVLKADVQGTCEAVKQALEDLSTNEVGLKVLSAGVGAVTENDVMLARASEAIVIGFNVRPDPAARRSAEGQGIDVRTYTVIYELVDDVRAAMAGLLPPVMKENFLGRAEVRALFQIPKVGTIAGCQVVEGRVRRNARCRLVRDGVQVHEGRVGSLRRFKDDVREVGNGMECGIGIEGYNDVKEGDVIEAFELEETPATL